MLIEIPLEPSPEDKTRLASSNIEKLIRVACASLSITMDPKSIEQVSTAGMHHIHVRICVKTLYVAKPPGCRPRATRSSEPLS